MYKWEIYDCEGKKHLESNAVFRTDEEAEKDGMKMAERFCVYAYSVETKEAEEND